MATEVQYTQKITPVETCNIELWTAYAKFNRYIREVNECNSANINQVSVPDMIRFRSYLADWKAYIENVAKVGDKDTPKTGTVMLKLPEPPKIFYVENDQINLLVQWLEVARDELLNSNSARRVSGMDVPDVIRQGEYLERCESILDYIVATQPKDYTESSPREDVVAPSETGVQPGANAIYNQRTGLPV